MEDKILDGKKICAKVKAEVKAEIDSMDDKPHLAVIKVGNDPASEIYVHNKEKACAEVGINFTKYELPESILQNELIDKINELNDNSEISGILVQLPLPKHINKETIMNIIHPRKDVDGLNAINRFLLSEDKQCVKPCTPKGVIRLLDEYKIPIKGKHAVVIGRSNLVGKPLAAMLLQRDASVTTCHILSEDIKSITLTADIVCVAAGAKYLLTEDMVKDGVVVIDIGMTREDRIYGDVDFDNVIKKASYITPMPGGTGPMTIAALLDNVLELKKRN